MSFACIKYYCLDTKILIAILVAKIESQQKTIDLLIARITVLEAAVAVYKNKKNSNNSHTPASRDENRPMKNQSLREKTGNKIGGQPGREGKTLECSATVDETINYIPDFCNCCSEDLTALPACLIETRQVIDIPVIKPLYIEHRIYGKSCTCGHNMESAFAANVVAKVQYGSNVQSLVGYLHARQYLPYKRMKEFFTDVMGLPLSVGGIAYILNPDFAVEIYCGFQILHS